jgi:hypothetical protein
MIMNIHDVQRVCSSNQLCSNCDTANPTLNYITESKINPLMKGGPLAQDGDAPSIYIFVLGKVNMPGTKQVPERSKEFFLAAMDFL